MMLQSNGFYFNANLTMIDVNHTLNEEPEA